MTEDPGWRKHWWVALSGMLPPLSLLTQRRFRGDHGLTRLRSTLIAFCTWSALFGLVISIPGFLAPEPRTSPGIWAFGVAGFTVADFLLVRVFEKPLVCDDEKALAQSYATRFFVRVAFAQSSAMLALVATFVTGRPWLYWEGLALAAIGFARAAPTKAHFEADQWDLQQGGCQLSLVSALATWEPDPTRSWRSKN